MKRRLNHKRTKESDYCRNDNGARKQGGKMIIKPRFFIILGLIIVALLTSSILIIARNSIKYIVVTQEEYNLIMEVE